MKEALLEAQEAYRLGEIPVGAIIEKDGKIIGRGHNMTRTLRDSLAHAEIMAIREATENLGGWRTPGCNMYVTLEPCSMCAGAIVLSRIENLYIGAVDPKSGACGSVFNIVQEDKLNHFVNIETGICKDECSKILKDFFAELRYANKAGMPADTENTKDNESEE